MASISSDPNGNRTIQFVAGDGRRRSIRLGKLPLKVAREIKTKIEALNAAAIAKISLDRETAEWVGRLDAVLYDKLTSAGLLARRGESVRATLGAFIESYVASRTDVKPATKEIWGQGRRGMIGYFGQTRPLMDITPGDADGYKLHLIGTKLAPMTVRKRLQFAKMICRSAVRHRLIAADPFAEITVKAGMPDRRRFISREETDKLLRACPDHHWQTILALARFGGLRTPSETLSLRWQDIDWENDRIIVQSPKPRTTLAKRRARFRFSLSFANRSRLPGNSHPMGRSLSSMSVSERPPSDRTAGEM